MKPLILTCFLIPEFLEPNVGDIEIFPYFKFVGEQLPSPDELAAYLGSRTSDRGPCSGEHWSDFSG
ncbi:MAG: hypothetical protein KGL62_16480 [Bradyrhizobium sp.]|uniref:hypothetical protein n=1 Tax=Bradyrhizobium sp. TaxID=376 RepID=UPI00239D949F|nr:hypothetical protein [Bradyrhizobium sp.]MDE2603948.1 hypothetical protein [Bradyrhizobium sp.]